jgi:predicted nucleotidyltransferase
MSTQEIIEWMVRELVTRFHPEQVILFGSQARGDATPDSDVDLLVVMPGDVNRREVAVDILHALHNMPLPKDVIVTTPHEIATRGQLPSTVLHTALHEGKVLYAQ